MNNELNLFGSSQLPIPQQFELWKATPGGRVVLFWAYRLAAAQADRYRRFGQRGSIRLIWENLRYRLNWIRQCARTKGRDLERWGGYFLNDHFHAHVARHIMEHRPEWQGMFETRALNRPKKLKRTIVVREEVVA